MRRTRAKLKRLEKWLQFGGSTRRYSGPGRPALGSVTRGGGIIGIAGSAGVARGMGVARGVLAAGCGKVGFKVGAGNGRAGAAGVLRIAGGWFAGLTVTGAAAGETVGEADGAVAGVASEVAGAALAFGAPASTGAAFGSFATTLLTGASALGGGIEVVSPLRNARTTMKLKIAATRVAMRALTIGVLLRRAGGNGSRGVARTMGC